MGEKIEEQPWIHHSLPCVDHVLLGEAAAPREVVSIVELNRVSGSCAGGFHPVKRGTGRARAALDRVPDEPDPERATWAGRTRAFA
jgi:hypothetical protein